MPRWEGVRIVRSDSDLSGTHKNEKQHRRELCLVGRWLYERGHIVACEGNVSVRLDGGRILTTPTCMNKGMLEPEDLVVVDLEGRHLEGVRKASSEVLMHLLFYRMRRDVHAICHAHPPTATGFAAAGRAHRFLSHGDHRAHRENYVGRGKGWHAKTFLQPGSSETDGGSYALRCT